MKHTHRATCLWLALAILLAGCSAAEEFGSSASAPSTPITAGTRVPGAPDGPLLADGQRSGGMLVWLSSDPIQPVEGNAQLDTYLTDEAGRPLSDARVTYDNDMTNMSHGLYLAPAEPAAAGHYVGRVHFSMPGPWRVITIVERTGQPPVRVRFEFRVK